MKKYWDTNSGKSDDYDAIQRRKGNQLWTPGGPAADVTGDISIPAAPSASAHPKPVKKHVAPKPKGKVAGPPATAPTGISNEQEEELKQ